MKKMLEVVGPATRAGRDHRKVQKMADGLLVITLFALTAVYISSRVSERHRMPEKVVDSAEAKLYLSAGGLYTDADIVANGRQRASEKFERFQAKHDFDPRLGDAICPITRTKANPACSWIIGGNEYFFCCPPCIDEFLIMAKSDPGSIEEPSHYVQRRQTR